MVSVLVCATLVGVGLVRFASYSQGTLGDAVRHSFVGFIAYDPTNRANAQYFKILATPSVIAGIYLFFRWRNAGSQPRWRVLRRHDSRRIDFQSPLLRLILTSAVTIHWLAMEWWKFHVEGFYPWSPLENRVINIAVLVAGQLVALWAMKYLSFAPIRSQVIGAQDGHR